MTAGGAGPPGGHDAARRVRVKVCGITTPEDAALAVEVGADLLGLNFWPGSPRAVSPERGRAIADCERRIDL